MDIERPRAARPASLAPSDICAVAADDPPAAPLRARGADDLLGFAGHVLGTLPADSLVLVTLDGDGLRAVIRVDRPPAAALSDPDLPPELGVDRRWAATVAAVCRRDRAASAVLALVLGDAAGGVPLPRAGADVPAWWWHLEEALSAAGMPVREGWAVAAGRAWPWPAHPFAEPHEAIEVDPQTSDLSLHLVSRGSVWGLRDADVIPPQPGPRACSSAGEDPAWAPPARDDLQARSAWLAEWEGVLDGSRGAGCEDAALLCRLGAPLVHAAWRDALLLRALAGADAQSLNRSRRERLLTGASEERPPWRRMDRLWDAVRLVAGAAPTRAAAQALAVAGWVAWTRGQGSAAGAHAEAAARLTPKDGFIRVLLRLVESGAVCAWAADARLAWRP